MQLAGTSTDPGSRGEVSFLRCVFTGMEPRTETSGSLLWSPPVSCCFLLRFRPDDGGNTYLGNGRKLLTTRLTTQKTELSIARHIQQTTWQRTQPHVMNDGAFSSFVTILRMAFQQPLYLVPRKLKPEMWLRQPAGSLLSFIGALRESVLANRRWCRGG
jgi:hypothetical protein